MKKNETVLLAALGLFMAGELTAQPSLMENLGRGVVAVRTSATEVFVGWRVLGTDDSDVAFNLYRSTGGGAPVRLNAAPLSGPSHFLDATADLAQPNAYFVRPIVFGLEQPPGAAFTLPANAPVQQYLRVPLQVPAGGTTPVGEAYTYSPNDTSVGDLDGDGEYELVVKWDPSNAHDNSQSGYTGNVYLDAYELDGTRLWRIDLGRNIRAGAHYTQFMVYDLDGDGRAEVACRTADGTVDGLGHVIGDGEADWRNTAGYVLAGPEFLTIFDGRTGAALATTGYVVPRGTVTEWGDNYGNRVDRFLAAVAYLDGRRPSLVMARGYYTRTVLAAWNWRDGALSNVWTFDTGNVGTANPYAAWRGQGNHNLSVGDVDGDGRDEIMYGACAIDDDGTGLFSTHLGHGDALHMSDLDPDRPGLEVFQPHEDPGSYGPNAIELRDARTGALIFGVQGTGDIGRGLALDVDPRYRGYEMWGSGDTGGMYTAQLSTPNALLGPRGVQISATRPSINFGVWWDGDLLRELLDGTTIGKWDWLAGSTTPLLAPSGIASNNGTKATPSLSADILGDWREEVIWRESTNDALRVYTTTIPTPYRFYTLMHDRQYRMAVAWQNTAYNQPPHPGFYLGDGMAPPPVPNIVTSLATLLGPAAPVFTAVSEDTGASAGDFVTSDATIVISGTVQPGATVTLTRFGVGPVGTAVADAGGHWSLDLTGVSLPEGVTRFTATATDADGVTGPRSAPFSVTIDVTAPAPPVIETIAAEGTLVFSGTAEAGTAVELALTGTGPIGTVTAGADGRWTFGYSGPPLPAAAHSFTATATDLAGNTSARSVPFTVNTASTTPTIVAVEDDTGISASDGITADATLLLSGTAAAGDTVSVTLAGTAIGTATADGSGSWTFDHTASALADGTHTFRARAISGAGASPSSAAFPVVVDTAAPVVVSSNRVSPAAPTSTADTAVFRVTFSEPVAGIDAGDVVPTFTGGLSGSISQVSAAGGASVDVTIGPMTGEGTVRLDVAAGGATDLAGHALAAAFTAGQTYTRLLVGSGTWIRGATGGLWGDHVNWQEGVVGGGTGNTASFAAIEVEGDVRVLVDAPRTVGNLVFGDTDPASSASWIVDDNGDTASVLTLQVPAGNPTLAVNPLGAGAAVVLATPLAGTSGLTKSGPGMAVLQRPNTLSGPLTVNGGTLRLDPGSLLNTGTGTVNVGVNAGASLQVNGGSLTAGGLTTMGSGVAGVFTLDSGEARFAAVRTNSDSGSTCRVNGGAFTATDVNVRRNSAAAVDFGSGFIVAGGTATVGTIELGTNNSNGALTVSGGTLTASGTITVGNQVTAGRGGALRVTGGTFTSTDAVSGIVLARTNGANANNVASATFGGGVSTVEKLTLGFDATVTAGSATVTLNGGTVYLGAGGIVRNGTGTFATTVSLTSGVLGAKAGWSTEVPITLPAGGTATIKAGDATGQPRDIALAGPLSGAGGFTKAGPGALSLAASSTFSGPVALDSGLLRVDGNIEAGEPLTITGGGLTGSGAVRRAVVLDEGGTIQPGGAAPASVLTVASLRWDGGGTLAVDLPSAKRLAITGALQRGGTGALRVALSASEPLPVGARYTLATFTSTDAQARDFVASGPGDHRGVFLVGPTSVQFLVTGAGPTAAYTHWAYLVGLPAGQDGPGQDPDNDGLPNLLEFVLGGDPLQPGIQRIAALTVEADTHVYPAIAFVRRHDLGGVTDQVLASPDLTFSTLLDVEEVSVAPRADGADDVVVRSSVPLSERPNQFFRLGATFPAPVLELRSRPAGVMTGGLRRGLAGLSVPLIQADLFVGAAASVSPARLTFPESAGNLGALLTTGGKYYVEVLGGPFEGERFDVDADATIDAGDSTLVLAFGPGSLSTRAALPNTGLVGTRLVLRPHLTLDGLRSLLMPGLVGSDNFVLADAVQILEDGQFQRYSLRADGETWNRLGRDEDFRSKALPPDASFLVESKRRDQSFLRAGNVRTSAFRKNLVEGFQAFATGFPVNLSPLQAHAFVDPAVPAGERWTGNNVFSFADQIEVILGDPKPFELYYLRGDGSSWRTLTSTTNFANAPILGATSAIVVRRIKPDASYRIAPPFGP